MKERKGRKEREQERRKKWGMGRRKEDRRKDKNEECKGKRMK